MKQIKIILLLLVCISCTKEESEPIDSLTITDIKVDEQSVTFKSYINPNQEFDEVGFLWLYGKYLYNYDTTVLFNNSSFSYELSHGLVNDYPYQVCAFSRNDTVTEYGEPVSFNVNFDKPVVTNKGKLDIGHYSDYTKLFAYNNSLYTYTVSEIKKLSDEGYEIIRTERNLFNSVCVTVVQDDLWILGHIAGEKYLEIFSMLDYSIQLFKTEYEFKFLVSAGNICFGITDNSIVNLTTNKLTLLDEIVFDAYSVDDNLYITTENNSIKKFNPHLNEFSIETKSPIDELYFAFSSNSKLYYYIKGETEYYDKYYILMNMLAYDRDQKVWYSCPNVPNLESRADYSTKKMDDKYYQILFNHDEMYLFEWFPDNVFLFKNDLKSKGNKHCAQQSGITPMQGY
jgi:hypothetical protein